MQSLPDTLPRYPLRTRASARGAEVWDGIRKGWFVLTPEEEVRQCAVQWLTDTLRVPPAMLALERSLPGAGGSKRFDILLFGREGTPLLLAECKAPHEPVGPAAALQAAVYNAQLGAPLLLLTNGGTLWVYRCQGNQPPTQLAALDAYPFRGALA
jgi:hypothetical protein